jgi:hypothetical protein
MPSDIRFSRRAFVLSVPAVLQSAETPAQLIAALDAPEEVQRAQALQRLKQPALLNDLETAFQASSMTAFRHRGQGIIKVMLDIQSARACTMARDLTQRHQLERTRQFDHAAGIAALRHYDRDERTAEMLQDLSVGLSYIANVGKAYLSGARQEYRVQTSLEDLRKAPVALKDFFWTCHLLSLLAVVQEELGLYPQSALPPLFNSVLQEAEVDPEYGRQIRGFKAGQEVVETCKSPAGLVLLTSHSLGVRWADELCPTLGDKATSGAPFGSRVVRVGCRFGRAPGGQSVRCSKRCKGAGFVSSLRRSPSARVAAPWRMAQQLPPGRRMEEPGLRCEKPIAGSGAEGFRTVC